MAKPLNAVERQQRLPRSAEPQGQMAQPKPSALPPVAAQSWQQRAAQAYCKPSTKRLARCRLSLPPASPR